MSTQHTIGKWKKRAWAYLKLNLSICKSHESSWNNTKWMSTTVSFIFKTFPRLQNDIFVDPKNRECLFLLFWRRWKSVYQIDGEVDVLWQEASLPTTLPSMPSLFCLLEKGSMSNIYQNCNSTSYWFKLSVILFYWMKIMEHKYFHFPLSPEYKVLSHNSHRMSSICCAFNHISFPKIIMLYNQISQNYWHS